MSQETKKKILKVAKKAIKVTHKISIFGLKAYLNYHTGEVTSTIKIIRMALIVLLAIRNYYYSGWEGEDKQFEVPFKIIAELPEERYIT